MVEAWEHRLGVLNQMVGSVEPRPEVWDKIKAAIGHSEPQAPLVLPEAPLRRRSRRDPSNAGSPRSRTIPTSSACPARRGAGARSRRLTTRDRRGAGRDAGGRRSIGRNCCPTAFVRSRAPRWSRSRRRRRRQPSAQYVAVLQKDRRRRRPSFSRSTARPRISPCARSAPRRRARQELRALAGLRQAAAAAFARRDRRQRFHRAAGAGVLRPRHHQQRDLRGDGRTGGRLARRQAAPARSSPAS